MLEVVAELAHVASRERPSRRSDEDLLLRPQVHPEQRAIVPAIDRLEHDFRFGGLHDCPCTKSSRVAESLSFLTDVIRSANCRSDYISDDPTSTSTPKIENCSASLRSFRCASHS